MIDHICKEIDYCTCNQLADEPDENCPIHGSGIFPPRCCICGRFMKWEPIEIVERDVDNDKLGI